jgi:hypothetical protein
MGALGTRGAQGAQGFFAGRGGEGAVGVVLGDGGWDGMMSAHARPPYKGAVRPLCAHRDVGQICKRLGKEELGGLRFMSFAWSGCLRVRTRWLSAD